MDLRDIQRLHAQFAPDMITIDLPRQIAALPAPANMAAIAVSPTMRRRWVQARPIVRGSIIAVAVAALVGMAGMGAATLYKALSGSHGPVVVLAGAPLKVESTRPPVTPVTAPGSLAENLKDIDAAPAQPLVAVSGLDSSDLTGASPLGMTADQFRRSLKMGTIPTHAGNSPAATAQVIAESERAAISPIHRNSSRTSITPSLAATAAPTAPPKALVSVAAPTLQAAPAATVVKSAEPVFVQPVAQQVVAVSPALANPPLQAVVAAPAAPSATSPTSATTATVKSGHPARRHVSKPRIDPDSAAEPNASARAVTPSVPASRGGSNEVQMF